MRLLTHKKTPRKGAVFKKGETSDEKRLILVYGFAL